MTIAPNRIFDSRADMIAAIRALQQEAGQPVCSGIDDQAIGQQAVILEEYLSTVPANTPSGFIIDPASVRSYLGDQDIAAAIVALQNAYSTAVPAPYTFNLKKSNTSAFRSVYLAGARNTRLAFMGDSTMRGTDELATPYNAQFGNATPMKLAPLLQSAGIAAGANNLFGSGTTTIADLKLRDGRFNHSGAAVFGGVQTQGGSDFNFPTAASTISFTPQGNVTKFDIYWRDAAVGRNFSWAVDGGGATTINSSGVAAMRKTTVSAGAAGVHTLSLAWVAGSVNLFGIDAYDDTAGRVEVSCLNWGVNGGTTSTMIGNVGPPNGGRLQFITSFPPDLVIGELGIVNSWRNSMSVATAKAEMTTLVQAVKAAGSDFMFLTPPYDGSVLGLAANQNAYVDAMYEIAVSEDVPLIDIRQKWLSFANQTTLGLTGDNVHPTIAAGYPDTAAVVQQAVQYALTS